MSWPEPPPGLVIRYSYLWHREAQQGHEEGRKDRPCAVVVAMSNKDGSTRVYALPITHSAPTQGQQAIEIPPRVKNRLGLDGERSWIVFDEANVSTWRGRICDLCLVKAPTAPPMVFCRQAFSVSCVTDFSIVLENKNPLWW